MKNMIKKPKIIITIIFLVGFMILVLSAGCSIAKFELPSFQSFTNKLSQIVSNNFVLITNNKNSKKPHHVPAISTGIISDFRDDAINKIKINNYFFQDDQYQLTEEMLLTDASNKTPKYYHFKTSNPGNFVDLVNFKYIAKSNSYETNLQFNFSFKDKKWLFATKDEPIIKLIVKND